MSSKDLRDKLESEAIVDEMQDIKDEEHKVENMESVEQLLPTDAKNLRTSMDDPVR